MADIPLKLDESNEITFAVDITGSEPINGSPIVRLVCESNGISYVFHGEYTGTNQVDIDVPVMKGKLAEGTYPVKLEVILEDRYFVPLELEAEFKVSRKVVAEVVQRHKKEPVEPAVKAVFQRAKPVKESSKKTPAKQQVKRGSLQDRFKKGLL